MSSALERRVEALEGKTIEVGDLTYVFERDPQGDLKEALRRNAEGADPAPHLSDDELYARFKEGLESGQPGARRGPDRGGEGPHREDSPGGPCGR